jgi:hypothetical protein
MFHDVLAWASPVGTNKQLATAAGAAIPGLASASFTFRPCLRVVERLPLLDEYCSVGWIVSRFSQLAQTSPVEFDPVSTAASDS